MRRLRTVLVATAAVVLIALLAWPVKEVCPNGPCSTAPDAQGYVHRYYEVKPLAAVVIDTVSGKGCPLRYASGEEKS